jgi:hypothetical protein
LGHTFMNALPSFEPPTYSRKTRKSSGDRSTSSPTTAVDNTPTATQAAAPRPRSRPKSNPAYAHRRQGLELITKSVAYSILSVFGVVTLVNSIGYSFVQRNKLQHLETEVHDTQIRTEKTTINFNRSFDPQAQKNVMAENSYKVAPDRLQIFLVNSSPDKPLANNHNQ